MTNPPYRRDLLPALVEHWLSLLEPIGGQLCLLLRSLWGESQRGQASTSKHPAYAGRIKLPGRIRWLEGTDEDKGGSPQHEHCWVSWDWSRDMAKTPFEISAGDPRLQGARYAARHWMAVAGTQSSARTALGLREVARGGTPYVRTQPVLSSRRLTRRCRKDTPSTASSAALVFRCWHQMSPQPQVHQLD